MNTATATEALPWYRHRILWLVIAIPALTVAGCMLTIYLAISTADQLVSDELSGGRLVSDPWTDDARTDDARTDDPRTEDPAADRER